MCASLAFSCDKLMYIRWEQLSFFTCRYFSLLYGHVVIIADVVVVIVVIIILIIAIVVIMIIITFSLFLSLLFFYFLFIASVFNM